MSRLGIPGVPESPRLEYKHATASPEERLALSEVNGLLGSIHSEVSRFRAAIALADVGFDRREGPIPSAPWLDWDFRREWPVIAAHAAIASLFHIKDLIKGLGNRITSPDLRRYFADDSAVVQAAADLDKTFPKATQSRHSTAHSGQIRAEADKNFHRAPLQRPGYLKKSGRGRMIIQNTFHDRTFVTTRKGEIIEFELTWDSYINLFNWFGRMIALLTQSMQGQQTVNDQSR